MKFPRLAFISTIALAGFCHLSAEDSFRSWSLPKAVEILTESPWVRQETFTRVVGGIGSGIRGEKEIYSTFFVRLLSAEPVRKAYARIKLINLGYDRLPDDKKEKVEQEVEQAIELDVSQWVVVALSFRSNNPNQEASFNRFLERQTLETMKTRAYLSTERIPRIQLNAYYPPKEASVGAKFVFPRIIDGSPVASTEDSEVIFEFDPPGNEPVLRAIFPVKDMIKSGKLIL
jgi:hypothetical protein